MKIKEAQQAYRTQIQAYGTQKNAIAKQQEALQEKINATVNGAELFADEAAILQLTYDALDEKQNGYQEYLEQLNAQWEAIQTLESTKQQGEAAKEAGTELAKIMEVVRRIMKGGKVPGSDERKVMEYDSKLYQMAKSVGAMAKQRKRKEYDSLWEDEEKKETVDPLEKANNTEVSGSGPEIVSVEATMETTGGSMEGGGAE